MKVNEYGAEHKKMIAMFQCAAEPGWEGSGDRVSGSRTAESRRGSSERRVPDGTQRFG